MINKFAHEGHDHVVKSTDYTDSSLLIPIVIGSVVLFIALVVLIMYARRNK